MLCHLTRDPARCGGVDCRRIAALVAQVDAYPVGRLDTGTDAAHPLFQGILQFSIERAHGTAQHGRLRQHIVGMAGMEARHAHHRRIQRIRVARHQRLQCLHQRTAGQHHVHRLMRHRGVAAMAGDLDFEAIGAGHHRTFGHADAAGGQAGPVVQAEHHVHREALEQPLLDHDPPAAFMLLRRLENEIHGAVEVAQPAQRLGRAEKHCRMAVVAAGVHPAVVRRMVRKGIQFLQGQGVHVGAQADRAPAAAAGKLGHHTGAGYPAMDLEAESLEIIGDLLRGSLLVEGQFRMGMDIAAKCGDLRR